MILQRLVKFVLSLILVVLLFAATAWQSAMAASALTYSSVSVWGTCQQGFTSEKNGSFLTTCKGYLVNVQLAGVLSANASSQNAKFTIVNNLSSLVGGVENVSFTGDQTLQLRLPDNINGNVGSINIYCGDEGNGQQVDISFALIRSGSADNPVLQVSVSNQGEQASGSCNVISNNTGVTTYKLNGANAPTINLASAGMCGQNSFIEDGQCVCVSGFGKNSSGVCVKQCGANQTLDTVTNTCVCDSGYNPGAAGDCIQCSSPSTYDASSKTCVAPAFPNSVQVKVIFNFNVTANAGNATTVFNIDAIANSGMSGFVSDIPAVQSIGTGTYSTTFSLNNLNEWPIGNKEVIATFKASCGNASASTDPIFEIIYNRTAKDQPVILNLVKLQSGGSSTTANVCNIDTAAIAAQFPSQDDLTKSGMYTFEIDYAYHVNPPAAPLKPITPAAAVEMTCVSGCQGFSNASFTLQQIIDGVNTVRLGNSSGACEFSRSVYQIKVNQGNYELQPNITEGAGKMTLSTAAGANFWEANFGPGLSGGTSMEHIPMTTGNTYNLTVSGRDCVAGDVRIITGYAPVNLPITSCATPCVCTACFGSE